jgi:integrase
MKLTQPTANSLALPPGKMDAIFFDDDLPGLGLRLRASGVRSWVFQYQLGTKQRRMTLGSAPAVTLAMARKTAGDLHARVRLGEDPAAAKREGQRRAADTVEATLRSFLPAKRADLRPRSYISLERHLLRYAKPLHSLGVALVTRRDVASVLTQIAAESGNPTANRSRASLSAFFAWCMKQGLVDANPVVGTHVAAEQSRERVLSVTELAAVWRACEGKASAAQSAYSAIVKLLILTGQRREEIGGLRFDEIRDGMIVLPGTRTKNKRAHVIPLPVAAQAILAAHAARSTFVFGDKPFTSWSRGKQEIDAKLTASGAKVEPWRLHDIRRSVATGMAEQLGIQPHIIEAVLNHVSGHKAGVAGIYNRATYDREKRYALDLWSDHVTAAVEGRASNVVQLARAAS